jgi:hypothetical protein
VRRIWEKELEELTSNVDRLARRCWTKGEGVWVNCVNAATGISSEASLICDSYEHESAVIIV